jgi:hypothetical protein
MQSRTLPSEHALQLLSALLREDAHFRAEFVAAPIPALRKIRGLISPEDYEILRRAEDRAPRLLRALFGGSNFPVLLSGSEHLESSGQQVGSGTSNAGSAPQRVRTGSALRFFTFDGTLLAAVPTDRAITVSEQLSHDLLHVPDAGLLASVPRRALEVNGYALEVTCDLQLAPTTRLGEIGRSRRQIEAHLYAEDLAKVTSYLRKMYAPAYGECYGDPPNHPAYLGCWDLGTNASELPHAVVLPFPPNDNWDDRIPYDLGLLWRNYFWPNNLPPAPWASSSHTYNQFYPAPDTGAPTGSGSIKSVRVYVPGACSVEIPLQPLLQGIHDQIWETIKGFIRGTGGQGYVVREYCYVTTFMDEGLDGTPWIQWQSDAARHDTDIASPSGGFFVFCSFYSSDNVPIIDLGSANQAILEVDAKIAIAVNYEYKFVLNSEGHIDVTSRHNDSDVELPKTDYTPMVYDAFHTQIPKAIVDALNTGTANQKGLIQTLSKSLLSTHPIGGSADIFPIVGAIVNDAKRQADAWGLTSDTATPADKRMAAALADIGNWVTLSKDGVIQDPDCGGFIAYWLRPKRLNLYPDALELVWFDDVEFDNPVFALYLAATWWDSHPGWVIDVLGVQQPAPQGLSAALCGRPTPKVGPGAYPPWQSLSGSGPAFTTRAIARVRSDFTDVGSINYFYPLPTNAGLRNGPAPPGCGHGDAKGGHSLDFKKCRVKKVCV